MIMITPTTSRPLPELSPAETRALEQRFTVVLERLQTALKRSGRSLRGLPATDAKPVAGVDPGLGLVAVSKFHKPEKLAALARLWQKTVPGLPVIFSENYIQEALGKQDALAGSEGLGGLHWHFSGHLQSNKARQALGRFELLHTLDSLSLARNLQKLMENRGEALGLQGPQPVLAQVNIGDEGQKSGVAISETAAFIRSLQAFSAIRVQGLMCLPPITEQAEDSRPYFIRLRQMRDSLERELGLPLPELSMGMSHDFEVAVEEGATLVRIGTDIFGERGK
jgi:pyridoxal phosphate enzyme (YggS family)